MYGIAFRGNDDCARSALRGFEGHPLRKDYRSRRNSRSSYRSPSVSLPAHHPAQPDPAGLRQGQPRGLVIVNIGPSHPATHGTIQIVRSSTASGRAHRRALRYLHRASRRSASRTPGTTDPYVDRLNYCSALINDFAYCEAVEKLMGIEITRAVATCARCSPILAHRRHLTCTAAALMELGAMTAFSTS